MAQTPTREKIAEQNTWDLSPLYPSVGAWEDDYEELGQEIQALACFDGKLTDSAKALENGLRLYLKLSQRVEKLYTYAQLASDVDTANSENLGRLQQASGLYARFSAIASFISPELLLLEQEKLESFLAEDSLEDLRRTILDTVRFKPHTLSKPEEALLARGAEVFRSSERIFSQLNNADLRFENVIVDSKEVPLSHGNFVLFLKNSDRKVRSEAYQKYYKAFENHKNTIAASFTGSLKKDTYLAQAKAYTSARDRALFSENISPSVYDNLIETVSGRLDSLHTYYRLRKKMLGLAELMPYDLYVPLVSDVSLKHTYEEATELVCDSLAPLGEHYVKTLKLGLTEKRWVDPFENKGKRSGAYHFGCYKGPPYMLLNYKEDDINSVFTLAHEAGHAMHTYFSSEYQTYQDYSYTIFVAEVASTFNECLLNHHLKKLFQDDTAVKAFLVNQQIEDFRATFFRQTMFAEFEKEIHERAEANEALTVDVYRSLYRGILAKHFGSELSLDDSIELECLRIPHFYSAFYVYKYATGISAGMELARQVLEEGKSAQTRYLGFLRGGASKYPLELLRDAGADLEKPKVINKALDTFDNLVNELDGLLADLKSSSSAPQNNSGENN